MAIKGNERERKREFSVLPRTPPPPAQASWMGQEGSQMVPRRAGEFRELGGGTSYRPPGLFSV